MTTDKRGGARPGAGRPPKPVNERQRHSVTAKLSDEELRELKRAAKDEPLGSYVRSLIVRHLVRRRR